ncbi:sigma-70 family RNA polymerase sigma factor [Paenibacillus sp. HJGM_3]|uniref:sigma-70 family RNA polymerase sigma factor n=1 Tax=Paenibacillus sp. HJGM_3 TaxID=3379816 RepID=UPI00385B76D7
MEAYIEQARQGDRQAFEKIVTHYSAMAKAVAYEKLRDVQLTEDAVQEAFTEAFLHLPQLRAPAAFPGWFKAIVARQCYRILRRRRVLAIPYDEAERTAEAAPGVAEAFERREAEQAIHDSIAALTANMRIAVQLFYFQGYSLQEMSRFLGVSVPALKKRLFDARLKLKGALPVADLASVFHNLYEGGRSMLHIVNGDSVAEKLRQGIVQGEILVWREVYPHGPAFVSPEAQENRAARAQYLELTIGVPSEDFIRISAAQEKVLEGFRQYEEVVLWFEHDLFDQTMLSRLLHWFAGQPPAATKLSLLSIGDYPGIERFRGLGQLTVGQLKPLSGTWRPIGAPELELGRALWQAYASEDPRGLERLLHQDTSPLPFAQEAFRAHLARFPSTTNGLGLVEQTTLERIQEGAGTPFELFEQVGDQLSVLGMGDLEYWHILRKMSHGSHPLLEVQGVSAFPAYNEPPASLRDCTVSLTELGKRVLNGQEDWIGKQGIDEWYGGVHLQGHRPRWRWNRVEGAIREIGDGE